MEKNFTHATPKVNDEAALPKRTLQNEASLSFISWKIINQENQT